MSKKIPLIVLCSHRKHGNSKSACEKILQGMQKVNGDATVVSVCDYSIEHCIACNKCAVEPFVCVLNKNDDMPKFLQLIENASAIVFLSPIYFYALPARIKAIMDRSQPLWHKARNSTEYKKTEHENIEQKKAVFTFLYGGQEHGKKLFEGAKLSLHCFYNTLNLSLKDTILAYGIDNFDDLLKCEDLTEQLISLGERLWQAGECE